MGRNCHLQYTNVTFTFLERTVRISHLSFGDGKSQKSRRSNLPGRSRAASSRSGLLQIHKYEVV